VCAVLDVELSELAGSSKKPEIAELRGLVVLLGVERFGQKIARLAEILGKHPGSLSYAAGRFAQLRRTDKGFRQRFDRAAADLMRRVER
jgi:hypothetical protein